MCPNESGMGAIDRSYPPEHVFDPYWTLEVTRKFFMVMVWAIHPEKPAKNGQDVNVHYLNQKVIELR